MQVPGLARFSSYHSAILKTDASGEGVLKATQQVAQQDRDHFYASKPLYANPRISAKVLSQAKLHVWYVDDALDSKMDEMLDQGTNQGVWEYTTAKLGPRLKRNDESFLDIQFLEANDPQMIEAIKKLAEKAKSGPQS